MTDLQRNRFEPTRISAEKNLEGYPFFLPNVAKDNGEPIRLCERVELADGLVEERDWEVSGHRILGLPRAFDQDLYMSVLFMLELEGGPDEDGRLYFKNYDLLSLGGLSTAGSMYRYVRDSIERIGSATIRTRNSFYSPRLGRRIRSRKFQLWDSDLIYHDKRGSNLELNWIQFHEVFLESYREGYIDRLDVEFYRSLHRPLTKRIYRLLNDQCDANGCLRLGVWRFRSLVPFSSSYDEPNKFLRKAKPAFEELQSRGFLKDVRVIGRGGSAEIAFELSKYFGRRRIADKVAGDPLGNYVMGLLGSYGMTRVEAGEKIRRYGPRRCLEVAEALPHQKKRIERPVGWIKDALKENYEFPDYGRESPAEVDKENKAKRGQKPKQDSNSKAGGGGSKRKKTREDYSWFFGDDQNDESGADDQDAERRQADLKKRDEQRKEAAERRKEGYEWLFGDEGQLDQEDRTS